MNDKIRPITKGMKELLFVLATRERENLPPLPMHNQRHAKGLVIRSLVDITDYPIGGKTITAITLNDLGKAYLHKVRTMK